VFLAFELALAFEPGLILEVPVDGKTVHGDILNGKLALSSSQGFQILSSQGKQVYRASLGPNHGLVFSDDGGFFGIVTHSKGASPGFLAAERFEFFSSDGKKLWEIENPGASAFHISDGARLILGMSGGEGVPESGLLFYNQEGKLITTTKIRLPQGVVFSHNGKHVFIHSAKDGLLGYDDSGNLTSNFRSCEKFAVSRDGDYVAIVSNGELKLFHQTKPTGNSLKIDVLVRGMSFSPEDKYMVVVGKKDLYLLEVENGKLRWRHTLNQPGLSFISADVSSNAERTIAGVDFDKGRMVPPEERHTEGLVYILDGDGQIIWQRKLSYKLWGASFPRVHFSADRKRFSVTTREKIYLFDLGQPER
jgi:outer membrane protein assembly factor BamB